MKLTNRELDSVVKRVQTELRKLKDAQKDEILNSSIYTKEYKKVKQAIDNNLYIKSKLYGFTKESIFFSQYKYVELNNTDGIDAFVSTEARACKSIDELITLTVNHFKNGKYEKIQKTNN